MNSPDEIKNKPSLVGLDLGGVDEMVQTDNQARRDSSDHESGSEHSADDMVELISTTVSRIDTHYPAVSIGRGFLPTMALALRCLGVIYGDIGTSPLYVWDTIFDYPPNHDEVLGACSLIIWELILVVSIKYIVLVMRVDNHGEGGIFALLSILLPVQTMKSVARTIFTAIALIGSAFVIGDGVITPAISVLSAIEGIEIVYAGMKHYEVYLGLVILLALFLAQRFGTSKVGATFGPIMLLYFISIAIIGILAIVKSPGIFAAFSPSYAILFLVKQKTNGYLLLGSSVLAVTGVEALYADMGHFGRLPIRLSWFAMVLPCVTLNYMGQGARLLSHPEDITNPYYLIIPSPVFWPMLIITTFAAIIASQAIITGSYSLVSQAVGFGYFPHVRIHHTSKKHFGQIYIPEVNYFLMVLTLVVVIGFRTSAHLAGAYGVAVSGVMFLTSLLYTAVLHYHYKSAWWKIALYVIVYYTIDLLFFTSTLIKVPNGGWLPISLGVVLALMMYIWHLGRVATYKYLGLHSTGIASWGSLCKILSSGYKGIHVQRVPMVGVFLSSRADAMPESVRSLLPRTLSLPYPCLFVTVKFVPVPYVAEQDRCIVNKLSDVEGVYSVLIVCGYAQSPLVSDVINKLVESGSIEFAQHLVASRDPLNSLFNDMTRDRTESGDKSDIELQISGEGHTITYFIGREHIEANEKRWFGHRLWVCVYAFILRNARSMVTFLNLDNSGMVNIMEIGTTVKI